MAYQPNRKRRPRPPGPPPTETTEIAERQPRSESLDALIIFYLLAGNTLVKTAELVGCSKTTIDRRLADPSFRARVEDERTDLLRAVTSKIGDEAMRSVEVLAAIRDNPRATSGARVRAADRLLRLAFGTPLVEINQTTIVGGAGGPDPAEQLRTFLGKLRQRSEDLAVALPAAPIDVESTET
jgi:hypothetical protein